MTMHELSEDQFFAQLFARLTVQDRSLVIGPGDDCAALRWHDDYLMLLAVDQVIGERHYISKGPEASAPQLAGRKLLARNLSDIAAMGGQPRLCLLSMAFPPQRDQTWLKAFYEGLVQCAEQYQVAMIGGDLAKSPNDEVASLTIIGEVRENLVLRRSGAQPGDYLCMTGLCGDSFQSQHHLNFLPRCQEGMWLANNKYAKAMIDISDGLLLDASRLCRASHCGLELHMQNLPLRNPQRSLQKSVSDGEDFELLFAVAREKLPALQEQWRFAHTPLSVIGSFTADPAIKDQDGKPLPIEGWDHLRD